MPILSEQSLTRLNECDPHLVIFFTEIIKLRDFTVLCGSRGQVEQDAAFNSGNSKLKYPLSKHNAQPLSMAVDVAPYFASRDPGQRVSLNRFEVVEFGHYCLGVRDCMNLKKRIRWGGDWDGDFMSLTDNEFLDAFHWEMI